MSAKDGTDRVAVNAATMSNTLPSAREMKDLKDQCCGIHGAARQRKGIKRGTSAARRRLDKSIIQGELEGDSDVTY